MFVRMLMLCFVLGMVACEKAEPPVVLPPKGDALPGRVSMGENYSTRIFYDLEENRIVKTASNEDWDLSFDATVEGHLVRMNGGRGVNVLRTGKADFAALTALPPGTHETSWGFDDPKEKETGNYIGNRRNAAQPEVFIVRLPDGPYFKFQILAITDTAYRIRTGALSDTAGNLFEIRKNAGYNRLYYSFANGILPQPEPLRTDWDMVFTRYRYIYYNLDNKGIDFPYLVAGVLLNPYKVTAAKDSIKTFSALTLEDAKAATYSDEADIIGGFGWKSYNIDQGLYTVHPHMNYFIRTRSGKIYKLHFLDYYQSGVKGNPGFESQRLE